MILKSKYNYETVSAEFAILGSRFLTLKSRATLFDARKRG